MANFISIRVNIISLSSHVSSNKNPCFRIIAQDTKSGGMLRFELIRDDQNTQKVINDLFQRSIDLGKLFEALLKPKSVSVLRERFLRNPYDFRLEADDKIPPVFQLRAISEVEEKAEAEIKKVFTLNRRL